jgi:hypothetical protein
MLTLRSQRKTLTAMMEQFAKEQKFDFLIEMSVLLGSTDYMIVNGDDIGAWECTSQIDADKAVEHNQKPETVTVDVDNIDVLKEVKASLSHISSWAENYYLIHLFRHIMQNEPLKRWDVKLIETDKQLKKKQKQTLQKLYPEAIA